MDLLEKSELISLILVLLEQIVMILEYQRSMTQKNIQVQNHLPRAMVAEAEDQRKAAVDALLGTVTTDEATSY